MEKLIFATHNEHKLKELRQIVGNKVEIVGLHEVGIDEDIPETADTLAGNALQKARYIFERIPAVACFSDDTGLEVEALGGAPGVMTARYAGEQCSPADNIKLLLHNMEGESNRRAAFITQIALIEADGTEHLFEGRVDGEITTEQAGCGGFGYDPVFRPMERSVTFAELPAADKNAISHRGRAVAKLLDFISTKLDK